MISRIINPKILIRDALDSDMSAIQLIYSHHVLTGLASFEKVPPSEKEMAERRKVLLSQGYPYRVAEVDGIVRGYAYAGPFRTRSAYLYTVENSIYVSIDSQRQGVGTQLLQDLIDRCIDCGYRQMISVIGDAKNFSSIALHSNFGFKKIGIQPSVGFKFGRWVDSIIMQRELGDGNSSLPDNLITKKL